MSKKIIPAARIAQSIYLLRGQKVLLDFDLAVLYGVATKVLNQSVKRNRKRFPDDFMFRLTAEEVTILRSQIVTSNLQDADDQLAKQNRSQFVTGSLKHRELRSRPCAFTEQGVAMLSSVLNSERAVGERTRLACRRWCPRHRELGLHSGPFALGIDLGAFRRGCRKGQARRVCSPEPRREIGFHVREKTARYRTRKVSIRHA